MKLVPANELELRVPTPYEVVSSEASSASERNQKNQYQYHCLPLDRSNTPHAIVLMLHLFLKYHK